MKTWVWVLDFTQLSMVSLIYESSSKSAGIYGFAEDRGHAGDEGRKRTSISSMSLSPGNRTLEVRRCFFGLRSIDITINLYKRITE